MKLLKTLFLTLSLIMIFFAGCSNNYTETNRTQDLLNKKIEEIKQNKHFSDNEIEAKKNSARLISEIYTDVNSKLIAPDSSSVADYLFEYKKNALVDSTFEDYVDKALLDKYLNLPVENIIQKKGVTNLNRTSDTLISGNTSLKYSLSMVLSDIIKNSNPILLKGIVNLNVRYINTRAKNFPINYEVFKNNFLSLLNSELINIRKGTASDSLAIIENANLLDDYQQELKELKTESVNKLIIIWTLPLFAVVLLAIFILPIFTSPDKIKLFFENGLLLQVITIFLLIGTIIILSLSKIIEKEVVATLLGGISAYVLQRAAESSRRNEIKEIINEVKK